MKTLSFPVPYTPSEQAIKYVFDCSFSENGFLTIEFDTGFKLELPCNPDFSLQIELSFSWFGRTKCRIQAFEYQQKAFADIQKKEVVDISNFSQPSIVYFTDVYFTDVILDCKKYKYIKHYSDLNWHLNQEQN